jgi:hypothetical protein
MSYPNIDISEYIEIQRVSGNAERGGWECKFTSLSDTDLVESLQYMQLYWQGLFGTEETYGMIGMQGHVVPVQFAYDRVGSEGVFQMTTTDAILRNGWHQGIHFRDVFPANRSHYHDFGETAPANTEVLTLGRLVRHLLGYYDELGTPPATNPDWVAHTNLVYHATQNPHGWIDLSNVETSVFADPGNPNGSMEASRYIVRETNNMWSTIQNIAKNEFFVAYFTKENELYYVRHPMFDTVPPASVMTFDESFVVGKPVVQYRPNRYRQVKLHAVQDDTTTLHATYPSSPTHVYGNVDEQTYIRCNDQDTLDWWAEVKYGWLNRPYTVRWAAPGLCGLLFELYDPIDITYTGTSANGVHIDWTSEKFWITDISVMPDGNFSGTTVFTLEADYGMAT